MVFMNIKPLNSQSFAVELKSYKYFNTDVFFKIPEYHNYNYNSQYLNKLTFKWQLANAFAIKYHPRKSFIKSVGLEYGNLSFRYKGPTSDIRQDFYVYDISINKLCVSAEIHKIINPKSKLFIALKYSGFVFLKNSENKMKYERHGSYILQPDKIEIVREYNLPATIELDFGFDLDLFKINNGMLKIRLGSNIWVRNALLVGVISSGPTYYELIQYPKSLFVGFQYPICSNIKIKPKK